MTLMVLVWQNKSFIKNDEVWKVCLKDLKGLERNHLNPFQELKRYCKVGKEKKLRG